MKSNGPRIGHGSIRFSRRSETGARTSSVTHTRGSAPPDTGFGAHSELAVEVNFAAQGVNAAGYRLYAFYP